MSYRCIYCVQALTVPGYDLFARRYFRCRRSAERAVRAYAKVGLIAWFVKLDKREHRYVNPADVEG